MMASRGMGAIREDKMPRGKTMRRKDGDKFDGNGVTKRRKDGDEFTMYAEGGEVKSKVNEAKNYTKPGMRKSLFESIKSQAVQGTAAGQWSARKAQLLAKRYKEKGGGYKD
jgi:hypothetical protein